MWVRNIWTDLREIFHGASTRPTTSTSASPDAQAQVQVLKQQVQVQVQVPDPQVQAQVQLLHCEPKKRWQHICDHYSGKTRSIFIIFAQL